MQWLHSFIKMNYPLLHLSFFFQYWPHVNCSAVDLIPSAAQIFFPLSVNSQEDTLNAALICKIVILFQRASLILFQQPVLLKEMQSL